VAQFVKYFFDAVKFGLQFETTGSPKLQHGAVILSLLLCIKDAHVYHFGELLDMFSVFSLFFRCRQNENDYFVYLNRHSRRKLICNGYIKKKT